LASLQTQIHASDEEWKVIEPCLQAVVNARQTADYALSGAEGNAGFINMFGGMGGMGGGFPFGTRDSFADPTPAFGGGMVGSSGNGTRGGPPGQAGFGWGGITNVPGGVFPGWGGMTNVPAGGFAAGAGFPGGGGFPGWGGMTNFGWGGMTNVPGGAFPGWGGMTNMPGAGFPAGGFAGGFAGGGGAFPGGDANNQVALALTELRTALSSTNAPTADDLKEKLAAVRGARQKARADLAAAEEELRMLLTAEQEAMLVSLGYL
jgi:hypothetical protein